MGACCCNANISRQPTVDEKYLSVLSKSSARIKSCHFWEQDNTMTVCGYLRQRIIIEYKMWGYKLPKEIKVLVISFYGQQYQIVGIGRNGDGEFGLGHNEEVDTFIYLRDFAAIVDSPNDIFYGMCRFIVKNVYNDVYAAGSNAAGSLGFRKEDINNYDDENEQIMSFSKIVKDHGDEKDNFIRIISDGLCSLHTVFVTTNGNVYASGSNKEGQFGNGKIKKENYGLCLLGTSETFNHEIICKVEAGQMHTLFLTENGNVFSCGDNNVGQCGLPLLTDTNYVATTSNRNSNFCQLTPCKVPFLPSNIIDIKAGAYHNVLLSDDQRIYTFGDRNVGNDDNSEDNDNNDNKMDHGKARLESFFMDKSIESITCGSYFTVCIDTNNQCWLYGNNCFGEIGNGKQEDDVKKPYLFQSMNGYRDAKISKAFCGGNHTLLLNTKKDPNHESSPLYSFGNNSAHQCSGQRDVDVILIPHLLKRTEIGIGPTCNVYKVIAAIDSTIIIYS